MTDDELRRANEAVVRRFLTVEFFSEERRDLWAEDALFKLPLEAAGLTFRGRAAIHARALDSASRVRDFRVLDVVIHPMLDPNKFVATHGSEAVSTATGEVLRNRYASILTLRDGKIVHRLEFSDPRRRG